MDFDSFVRIVTAFADTKTDFDISRGHLIAQVRGELLEADIRHHEGELVVDDELAKGTPARQWIVTRVARLPQLADRIFESIQPVQPFVHPSGQLEDFLEIDASAERDIDDAVAETKRSLALRPGGATSLLYLTSDAGEGKTTVISHLAREQAAAYKHKETDWLLVPVTLAGRTFMRFDDIVIAEMVNRFRFQFFYYDGFLELIKLGVVVPAFDGFEEMFIEGSSGEALSALGTLVRSLGSAGSVLIAARKAYFEFRSPAIRAQMFDTISENAVSSARLNLCRWSKGQFLAYATARGFGEADSLYDSVTERLGADHAILTRAVLVKRLVDVAESHSSLDALLASLGQAPADYFHEFVEALLSREANEKWIDRLGDAARPLLTVAQHEELLGLVAQEMWISGSDVLRLETLALVADMFAENENLSASQAHQVKERLPQHSLLSTADQSGRQFIFDHEDFRRYFLGESVGRVLVSPGRAGLRPLLKAGALPPDACDAISLHVKRVKTDIAGEVQALQELGSGDGPSSYTRENCGALLIRLLDASEQPVDIEGISFPADALLGRWLSGHRFVDCHWQSTSVADSHLVNVTLERCRIDSLELSSHVHIENTVLNLCQIQSVVRDGSGSRTFDPQIIRAILTEAGFRVIAETVAQRPPQSFETDEESALVERMLRVFLRSTNANEDALRRRLGTRANPFFNDVLPQLRRAGVVEEVSYLGRGQQKRFRLAISMESVEEALGRSDGHFSSFLREVERLRGRDLRT